MDEELHPDLFGGETPIVVPSKSPIQDMKKRMKYRKAEPGEPRCKTCAHCMKISYHGKNYYKCELIGDSRGTATDIRLSDTCKHHEEEK